MKMAKMKNLKQIQKILASSKPELRKRYKVNELGIFGSYARGEQHKKSDVDVLVEFDDAPDLIKFIELERKIQKLIGRKVDLVRKKAIRSELRNSILKELITL